MAAGLRWCASKRLQTCKGCFGRGHWDGVRQRAGKDAARTFSKITGVRHCTLKDPAIRERYATSKNPAVKAAVKTLYKNYGHSHSCSYFWDSMWSENGGIMDLRRQAFRAYRNYQTGRELIQEAKPTNAAGKPTRMGCKYRCKYLTVGARIEPLPILYWRTTFSWNGGTDPKNQEYVMPATALTKMMSTAAKASAKKRCGFCEGVNHKAS